jgi:hypothetical protein
MSRLALPQGMYTDEFWLGDDEEVFAFDLVGRKRGNMAKLTSRRAMPASKFAGRSSPNNKDAKPERAPSKAGRTGTDGIRHNPLFTTRGQACNDEGKC